LARLLAAAGRGELVEGPQFDAPKNFRDRGLTHAQFNGNLTLSRTLNRKFCRPQFAIPNPRTRLVAPLAAAAAMMTRSAAHRAISFVDRR
jgi:hypothetical protein